MNTQYLKTMVIGLALLFASQGCSIYAGFSVKQKSSPQVTDNTKTVVKVQEEERAAN